MMQPLL